ncbi:hypothetical protein EZV62_026274 [Acer yangbiense]|uniref:SWIM-type domain-containing protein n=1 Tax=Acer yangbiense TaxID=1000413 RepID=A0A5C7GR40_9ROSI|nr:hypothetical protein EZV62_026274 [Acer yangbiense]
MDILDVVVNYDTTMIDLGSCDADNISLITLLHALSEKITGSEEVPSEEYCMWVFCPWSGERKEVTTDMELIDLFRSFVDHKERKIVFDVEKKPYIPLPPEYSFNIPNPPTNDFNLNLGFSDFANNDFNYEGDDDVPDAVSVGSDVVSVGSVGSDSEEVVEVDDAMEDGGVDRVGDEHGVDDEMNEVHGALAVAVVEDEDVSVNLELMEGYQSKSDDEYFSESEDEKPEAKIARLMKGNPFKKIVGGHIEFEVGQTHDNVYSLRALLKDYAIQEGFNFKKMKNDNNRLTYECKKEGCPWRLHASNILNDVTMQIKTYNNNHECHRVYRSEEARYAFMVQQCNPGSAVYIALQQPKPTFHRFFLSFEAQRMGFMEGCRPFIGIDGCHLKGPYGGVLLSAVALDANSGLYPLAVCICEGETLLSWTWFLSTLRGFLKYPEDRPICFMSDRQKGVLGALKTEWPKANIRYCARYIYANFRKTYSTKKLKDLFWEASRAYDRHVFKRVMADIGVVSVGAKAWLQEIEPKHWSRHAFEPSIKCDHVTNNMTEAFNSLLGEYRVRTYLSLLEYIRRLVMTRFQQRKEDCSRWKSEFPPTVNKKIVKASLESRVLKMIHAGEGEYEMLDLTRAYTAKLRDATCECGQWQISGVPCSHALAGIRNFYGMGGAKERLIDFIHPSLSKSAFETTYRSMIHPIPDLSTWADIDVQPVIPPPMKKKAGRPKLVRKREFGEKQKAARRGSVICAKCKQAGHNKRTCKGVQTSRSNKGAATDASSSQPAQGGGASSSQPLTVVQTQQQSQVTMHLD